MKKKSLFIRLFAVTGAVFFAGTILTAEEIELPDVTTVVSGSEIKVGKDALPDFSEVISDEETAVPEVIAIPEIADEANSSIEMPQFTTVAKKEKDLFVEGKVGGGFPGFFTGNFDIYRQSEENPFQLSFSHENAGGYAAKSAADGYFDSETKVSGEKTFDMQDKEFIFSLFYERNENGLQKKSTALNDIIQQDTGGKISFSLSPKEKFDLNVGSGFSYYSRYGEEIDTSAVNKYEAQASVFDFSPWLNASLTFDSFKIEFTGDYLQQNNLKKKEYLAIAGLDEQATYRGSIGARMSWTNQILTVFEEAHAVFGNKTGKNRSVLFPFTVGLNLNSEPDFLGGQFLFNVKGGLDSYQATYPQLEKLYKFSVLGAFAEETTDWYVTSGLSLPLGQQLKINGSVEYRKTAFENGVWQACYDNCLASGLYGFNVTERKMLKSDAQLVFDLNDFTLSAVWKRHWKDIPVLECENLLEFTAEMQSKDSKYGASCSAGFELGEESDHTPFIGAGGYVCVTPALRIAIETEDFVKLVTCERRCYAGNYYSRGGMAALLVKFNF